MSKPVKDGYADTAPNADMGNDLKLSTGACAAGRAETLARREAFIVMLNEATGCMKGFDPAFVNALEINNSEALAMSEPMMAMDENPSGPVPPTAHRKAPSLGL